MAAALRGSSEFRQPALFGQSGQSALLLFCQQSSSCQQIHQSPPRCWAAFLNTVATHPWSHSVSTVGHVMVRHFLGRREFFGCSLLSSARQAPTSACTDAPFHPHTNATHWRHLSYP